jgi:hypothetical protein
MRLPPFSKDSVMRLLIFALLAAGSAAAQTTAMYRTVATDGTVTFSDVPLSDDSEKITVLIRSGTTRSQQETQSPELASNSASDSIATQEEQNCTLALEHLQGLNTSARLYKILPDGEREFLTDEQVVTAREQAQAEVNRWCASSPANP